MKRNEKLVRVVFALILSYFVILYVSPYFFVNKTPHLNQQSIISLPSKVRDIFMSLFISSIPIAESPIQPTPTLLAPPTPLPQVTLTPTNTLPQTPSKTPVPPIRFSTAIPTRSIPQCPTTSNNYYSSLSIIPPATAHPETQADINMNLREYNAINEKLSLIDSAPSADDDPKAPQLFTLFSDKRAPLVTATYRVNNWDWNSNSRGGPIMQPKVTLVALAAKPGERFLLPQSGYSIGSGKQALVLYATKNFITLKYTREDNVVIGYTIHFDKICVDPNLLNLYNSLHTAGRSELPALAGGEVIGTTLSNYIMVAMRDTGTFMDPRIRKDWWIGY